MPDPLITLTTDFGEESPYVAAMKGVILTINPAARLVDLSHQVPPQNLRYAAFFLAAALPYWPPEALHVVVVDPGVGTERAILHVAIGHLRLLVPDNGCWTTLAEATTPSQVIRAANPRYWRPEVSATFHGRDIFAPLAGHLSLGLDPSLLGPAVQEWVSLALPTARREPDGWHGEVAFVDHFGNLITNIPGDAIPGTPDEVELGGRRLRASEYQRVRSYAEAPPGTLVALESSTGRFELAIVQGNAAHRFGAGEGTPVVIRGMPTG